MAASSAFVRLIELGSHVSREESSFPEAAESSQRERRFFSPAGWLSGSDLTLFDGDPGTKTEKEDEAIKDTSLHSHMQRNQVG